jgi:outer membrane protein TolC
MQISEVLQEANRLSDIKHHGFMGGWWDSYVQNSNRESALPLPVTINELISLTLKNSAQVNVYSEVPLIRETTVREADAAFDWTRYAETMWRQNNDPVGNTLTIGGPGNRFLDDRWTAQAGVKRRSASGATVQLGQQFGWQDTNSNFFLPADQGTARLTLDYTVPLMRGGGVPYNTSLQILTRIDVEVAQQEFVRQLQSHLLEVSRAYWSLYLERANLAQQVKLYLQTNAIFEELKSRQHIDSSQTQLASARAARENRLSDLIRVQAAVENAETRLRALINAVELGAGSAEMELLPVDAPTGFFMDVQLIQEVEQALLSRPEIKASMQEMRAACLRQNVAENELLPQLNFVTQAYLAGLRGNSNIFGAWSDQFSTGAPGYGVGLQYEIPYGNRIAKARYDRRRLELRQLQEKYRATLENIRAEVEIAVRELTTSQRELIARAESLTAAVAEAETIEARWRAVVNGENGTASLNLESLLRAIERVAQAEYDYAKALVTYNLGIVNLRRANGTLLQWENIDQARACEDGLPRTEMIKAGNVSLPVEESVGRPETNVTESDDAAPLPVEQATNQQ